MRRIILVLGDQLSLACGALAAGDKTRDVVMMAEVSGEAKAVKHHPKKIALIFAAMRKFAATLRSDGWDIRYSALDDAENSGSIKGEIARRQRETGLDELHVTQAGDWRLRSLFAELNAHVHDDDRFIASEAEFATWAVGRKTLRMEYFYREMRKKTGFLMDGGAPVGGKWNYDVENRKGPPQQIHAPEPKQFAPDDITQEVLLLVREQFSDHFGTLTGFGYATTAEEAEQAFEQFCQFALPFFGEFQDASLRRHAFLYHSCISAYMHLGLLDPLAVCMRVEQAYRAGHAPLNSAEGFIRQVLGWREYMRGIYAYLGPDYATENYLGHHTDLPALYWGAPTKMACMSHVVAQTRDEAYAHHIQRLMIAGNFALLCGVAPQQVHEWYLSVYIDALEWVELPNTLGMSQFADGGKIASKPYISSGAYINRMSDYCKGCYYDVKERDSERACPFNALYWAFLDRNEAKFSHNPRMRPIYRNWYRMEEERRRQILKKSDSLLKSLGAEGL